MATLTRNKQTEVKRSRPLYIVPFTRA